MKFEPLPQELLDHCRDETLRARDIMTAAADTVPDEQRKVSTLIVMLQSLTSDLVVSISRDREQAISALDYVHIGVGEALLEHYDGKEKQQ